MEKLRYETEVKGRGGQLPSGGPQVSISLSRKLAVCPVRGIVFQVRAMTKERLPSILRSVIPRIIGVFDQTTQKCKEGNGLLSDR